MPITFTAGYIEVWRDGVMLSRHRAEREAVESIVNHADTADDGEYEIRQPTVKVIVKRRITGPDAPALGPVLTISSTALTVTLDRPATGPTRIDRYELERYNGSAWTQIASGIAIFGAGNAYPDTNLQPSTLYSYRCRAIDTTARASEYSEAVGVTAQTDVNQAPVWDATAAVSIQQGSSGSIAQYCTDPDQDVLTFSKVGSTPSDVTVSSVGVVSVGLSAAVGATTLTVQASDGLLTANKDVALTVTAASTGDTLLLSEDFSSSAWYTKWHKNLSADVIAAGPPYNQTSEVTSSGTGTLRRVAPSYTGEGFSPLVLNGVSQYAGKATIASGTNTGPTYSFYPYIPNGNPGGSANKLSDFPTELYLEYYVRFGSTWCPAFGGKQPGFRGDSRINCQTGEDGSGNSGCDGLHGWSARGGYTGPCVPASPLNTTLNPGTGINSYVYHADSGSASGVSPPGAWGSFSSSCAPGIKRNTWYKVKYHCRNNTPGSANGLLEGWVNDVQVMTWANLRFDIEGNYPLTRVWMDLYHGGSAAAPQAMHIFYTNIRVWVP